MKALSVGWTLSTLYPKNKQEGFAPKCRIKGPMWERGTQALGVWVVAGVVACGSTGSHGAVGAGGNGVAQAGSTSGGGAGTAGSVGGDVAAGVGNVAGDVGMPGDCSQAVAAKDGAVLSAISPQPSAYVSDVVAGCDGSFVVTGEAPRGITFDRADGTKLALADAALWIAKLDAQNKLVWANAIPEGVSDDSVWAYPSLFPDGSVVVGGVFGTSATFGQGQPNETTLTTLGARLDGFIARYEADGTFAWVTQLGPAGAAWVSGIAAGPNGVTYVAVLSNNLPGFTLAPGTLDLKLKGGDWAIAKLDATGAFVAATAGTVAEPYPMKVLPAADGGVLVAGRHGLNAQIGVGQAGAVTLSGALFLAHFDDGLQLGWARQVPIPTYASGSALLPDGSGVFVGIFSRTYTAGAGEPNEITFTKHGVDMDGYVTRLDAQGKLAWAAQLASPNDVFVDRVAALPDGSVWVAGNFGDAGGKPSMLVLAPDTPNAPTLSANGLSYFVARFSPQGEPLWASQLESEGLLHTEGLAASAGSLVAVGTFNGSASFGSAAHQLTAKSSPSTFFLRLGP